MKNPWPAFVGSLREPIVASMNGGPARGVLILLVTVGLLTGVVAAQAAEGTTPSAAPPKDWDETVGLWIRRGPGHTRPVAHLPQIHNGVGAANRLLGAAQRRQLANEPCVRVLQTLREMQWGKPGPKFGCFRWYWEETEPVDTNAAFFIGGPLIVLDFAYGDQLDAESRTLLTAILKDLKVWFDGQAPKLTTIYPNKYMADLVYAWLLAEKAGDTAGQAKLATIMHQAAREWRDGHWGWGEHLSDGYCGVVIEQLSILLLLSKTLPDDLRTEYQGLLDELLAIEDAYSNRPRVPTIRCYAFDSVPSHLNFRERVRAVGGADPRHMVPPEPGSRAPPANTRLSSPLLYDLDWHKKMPPRAAPQKDIRIATGGGAEAICRAEPDMMLGTLTRYPILPNTDREISGLSWQTMPVAFVRNGTDWGFLRFYAREGERERGFPALEKRSAFLSNALSIREKPVPVGRTWSIQHGGDAVVLRIMPVVPASWDAYEDHLQIVRPTGRVTELPTGGPMSGLDLSYPERTFSVRLVPLEAGGTIERTDLSFSNDSPAIRWGLRLFGDPLHRLKRVVTLWGLSMNGAIDEPPKIEPLADAADGSVRVEWIWKNGSRQTTAWRLQIDPTADNAMVEEHESGSQTTPER
jgi:hypothetical protein